MPDVRHDLFDRIADAMRRARYPGRGPLCLVSSGRMKDGKPWRATTFHTRELPAPEWRSLWVDPMAEDEGPASA